MRHYPSPASPSLPSSRPSPDRSPPGTSRADVFLHNTAPGVVERLGLDGPTLRRADPRLVVVNISGYGTSGPRKDRKAYDMLIQAESGMVSVTGTPDTPTKTGVPSADIAAGLYSTTSVLSALFRRERTGEGAVVDVSMFDSAVEWMGHPRLAFSGVGRVRRCRAR
jgi:itaconate CoA-transferase